MLVFIAWPILKEMNASSRSILSIEKHECCQVAPCVSYAAIALLEKNLKLLHEIVISEPGHRYHIISVFDLAIPAHQIITMASSQ